MDQMDRNSKHFLKFFSFALHRFYLKTILKGDGRISYNEFADALIDSFRKGSDRRY